MVNINISLPEQLHKGLKLKSTIEDTTMKDYIINTISMEIKKKFNKEGNTK